VFAPNAKLRAAIVPKPVVEAEGNGLRRERCNTCNTGNPRPAHAQPRELSGGAPGTAPAQGTLAMKNTTLALFAALILLGWTSLAAGVIAVFAGQPDVSARAHSHELAPEPVQLFTDAPCPTVAARRLGPLPGVTC
jgi:hypothetical protein